MLIHFIFNKLYSMLVLYENSCELDYNRKMVLKLKLSKSILSFSQ